jgi:hypothetical protein
MVGMAVVFKDIGNMPFALNGRVRGRRPEGVSPATRADTRIRPYEILPEFFLARFPFNP